MGYFLRLIPNWAWFLVGCVLAGGPQFAFADEYTGPWGTIASTVFHVDKWGSMNSGGPYATGAAACAALGYNYGTAATPYYTQPSLQRFGCKNAIGNPLNEYAYAEQRRGCPYGGTLENSTGICRSAPACTAPNVRDPATGQCVPPPCEAGETSTMRLGVGYAKTANNVNDWINPGWAESACQGVCKVTVGAIKTGTCTVQVEGRTAPFPGFCDFDVTATGTTCTTSETAASQAATNPPPIPCPSGTALGEVNGVSGCYPTSTTTKTTTKTTNPDNTTTESTQECDTIGNCTTTEKTCDQAGNCTETSTKTGPGTGEEPGEEPGDDPEPDGMDDTVENTICKDKPDDPSCKGKGGNFGGPEAKATELYTKAERTMQNVFDDFGNKVQGSAVFTAADGFFSVSAGGSCPTWSASVPYIDTTIYIDQMCNGSLASALAIAGYVVLVGFAWIAFRIAIL